MDVARPKRTKSLNGARYFVVFVDDKSRMSEVRFLREKGEAYEAFVSFKNLVENQTGRRIKTVMSDNGLEFCNKRFDELLQKSGIKRRLTIPHTPQQNGVAERMIRTLVDKARCLMIQSGLPPSFWAEAVATANHIHNRCPTRSLD